MKKSIGKLICAPNQNYFFDAVVNQMVQERRQFCICSLGIMSLQAEK